jgi:hypothetical protein
MERLQAVYEEGDIVPIPFLKAADAVPTALLDDVRSPYLRPGVTPPSVVSHHLSCSHSPLCCQVPPSLHVPSIAPHNDTPQCGVEVRRSAKQGLDVCYMDVLLLQGQGMQNPLQIHEWQKAVADLVAEGAAPLRNGNPITDSNSQVHSEATFFGPHCLQPFQATPCSTASDSWQLTCFQSTERIYLWMCG